MTKKLTAAALVLCGGLFAIGSGKAVTSGPVATDAAEMLMTACPASRPASIGALPNTLAALHAGMPVTIVAVGSSSTYGSMSSAAAHTYPAELQRALNDELP